GPGRPRPRRVTRVRHAPRPRGRRHERPRRGAPGLPRPGSAGGRELDLRPAGGVGLSPGGDRAGALPHHEGERGTERGFASGLPPAARRWAAALFRAGRPRGPEKAGRQRQVVRTLTHGGKVELQRDAPKKRASELLILSAAARRGQTPASFLSSVGTSRELE